MVRGSPSSYTTGSLDLKGHAIAEASGATVSLEYQGTTLAGSVLSFTADKSPAELKRLVGDRLREHARYAAML
ncbi:protein of unknown function [Candidatus Filomicrobium marinum]|uniref:Uncharacterized protein n=2 Tax=Filomicrobium TaxID=119044 RepID=A0A0D6JBB8_9HYPH|nr:hypothetical protein [Candidatus Filomicrobium marinum]CFX05465.1 protein of unknown function [Candidatus Filomicrobium marinum]CPR16246.1 protein of unknown function [Candidatus Filomicrobium marinum]